MSIGAIASRARGIQARWQCESEAVYFWEPTGDTIYVGDSTNLTVRTDDAVREMHDPEVIEELEFCATYGRAQADLCGQGFCAGTDVDDGNDEC